MIGFSAFGFLRSPSPARMICFLASSRELREFKGGTSDINVALATRLDGFKFERIVNKSAMMRSNEPERRIRRIK